MAKRMPTKLFVKELEVALNRGDGYIMAISVLNERCRGKYHTNHCK